MLEAGHSCAPRAPPQKETDLRHRQHGLRPRPRTRNYLLRNALSCASVSLPVLDRLHQQFVVIGRTELPQSALGRSATYALNRWQTLTRYAQPEMGHVLIDQNSVERGIRPTKLGAKNWLYIGHPDAGWRSAVIYSITGTCKLLKVNPVDYLTWVLPQLATATSGQTDGLLPHDYTAAIAA